MDTTSIAMSTIIIIIIITNISPIISSSLSSSFVGLAEPGVPVESVSPGSEEVAREDTGAELVSIAAVVNSSIPMSIVSVVVSGCVSLEVSGGALVAEVVCVEEAVERGVVVVIIVVVVAVVIIGVVVGSVVVVVGVVVGGSGVGEVAMLAGFPVSTLVPS